NRLIRCVCGKKIGPDPRNFNQRVSLGRNDLLIRTFPNLASINKTQLRGCPVAIPPSSEAKKIMSKLHIFYKPCEELKNHIQSAQQTQLHLADALTDAAVN
ncbi:hypothetical protein PJ201_20680, partial [Escherichia coli]|nr:hypothetical protein [Escherichia coli]